MDAQYPEWTSSGTYTLTNDCPCEIEQHTMDYVHGWNEVQTIDTTDARLCEYFLAAGSDAWSGGVYTVFPICEGEYWIDFNPDGTARISTSQPTEWGKWAWDGSVNPSYVAPIVSPSRGKKHRK